ncbi:hypothetical protein AMS68_005470 [Peltaster fructicola]|uniref:Chaperone/heat shock protein Hsp12 n=1 Tax=Peltaster fructicola TaxID=286661 RepID=A0A6H0XYW7_9PEZI|nr:hypothetical protein AMS68_005470 [Peltaster fructicola]
MTDSGRKNLSDKIGDAVQPDSSKSTLDRMGDNLTGAGDKIARDAVPDSQKSTTQSVSDKFSREKDSSGAGETVGDKIKNAVGLGDKH